MLRVKVSELPGAAIRHMHEDRDLTDLAVMLVKLGHVIHPHTATVAKSFETMKHWHRMPQKSTISAGQVSPLQGKQRSAVTNWMCYDATDACAKKPPPVPKVGDTAGQGVRCRRRGYGHGERGKRGSREGLLRLPVAARRARCVVRGCRRRWWELGRCQGRKRTACHGRMRYGAAAGVQNGRMEGLGGRGEKEWERGVGREGQGGRGCAGAGGGNPCPCGPLRPADAPNWAFTVGPVFRAHGPVCTRLLPMPRVQPSANEKHQLRTPRLALPFSRTALRARPLSPWTPTGLRSSRCCATKCKQV